MTNNTYWDIKFKLPNTQWTLTGFSKAAYRTCFYIPELNIMFDAGNQNPCSPDHIFITHTHADHVASLPLTMLNTVNNDHHFNIYAPLKSEYYILEYIKSLFYLNSLSYFNKKTCVDKLYTFNGFDEPRNIILNIKNMKFEIDIFKCIHTIPTISYGFSLKKNKLKDEFLGMTNLEIRNLKMSKVEITNEITEKKFAYICDTKIDILETHPAILNFPIIIIECTFLYDDDLEVSKEKKHIHWQELKPYILGNPDKLFILIHFSQRYKDEDILKFFSEEQSRNENLKNIKPWV
jgi:ribonuclease Z